MSKKAVFNKVELETRKAVQYLEDLVAALKKGTIYLEKGDDYVELSPPPQFTMNVQAVQKKCRERLLVELSWPKGDSLCQDRTPEPELRILAAAPPVAKEPGEVQAAE
jgi:amphi-Trp domain-containing protein